MPIKNQMRLGLILIIQMLALCLMTTNAYANMSCSFSVSDIDFGDVDLAANTAFTVTGTLTASCTDGPDGELFTMCVHLDDGAGGSGSGGVRYMLNGADQLQFNMYKEASHSTIWGSLNWSHAPTPFRWQPTTTGSGNFNGSTTIYAKIPAGQTTLPTGLFSSAFTGGINRAEIEYKPGDELCDDVYNSADGTGYAPFTVSANNTGSCTVSASNLDFGSVGSINANLDTSSTVDVTCSNGLSYDVGLNNGLTGTGPTARKMTAGASAVTYGLYHDGGRTQPWGDTIGGNTASGTGTGSVQSLTVYGRVSPQTTPSAGTYTDTIVVTVTY